MVHIYIDYPAIETLQRSRVYSVRVYTKGMFNKIRIENHVFSGGLWFAAWLFTIGFLHLQFWQGVFAIIIWPYYLGIHFAP